jgi:hypothetical protein
MAERMTLRWLVPLALLGLWGLLEITSSRPCAACVLQSPPPRCAASLSSLSARAGDQPDGWWSRFAPQDAGLPVYLNLHYLGTEPARVAYRVDIERTGSAGQATAGQVIEVRFDPAAGDARHLSRRVEITADGAPTGDLRVTATRVEGDGPCDFPASVEASVAIVDSGPTVWAVTPRVCALPGERPQVSFGVRNPGPNPVSVSMVARASDPFGNQTFALGGGDDEVALPPIRLAAKEARQVRVDCATFGYCLAGAQNRVELDVRYAAGAGARWS